MKDRITQARLQLLVDHLNKMTDNKMDYSIGYAYGGARLESHNGSRNVLTRGTKREQWELIHAMLKGIYTIQDLQR